jgi:hypothetical protein
MSRSFGPLSQQGVRQQRTRPLDGDATQLDTVSMALRRKCATWGGMVGAVPKQDRCPGSGRAHQLSHIR